MQQNDLAMLQAKPSISVLARVRSGASLLEAIDPRRLRSIVSYEVLGGTNSGCAVTSQFRTSLRSRLAVSNKSSASCSLTTPVRS